jgi:hypothetical protein
MSAYSQIEYYQVRCHFSVLHGSSWMTTKTVNGQISEHNYMGRFLVRGSRKDVVAQVEPSTFKYVGTACYTEIDYVSLKNGEIRKPTKAERNGQLFEDDMAIELPSDAKRNNQLFEAKQAIELFAENMRTKVGAANFPFALKSISSDGIIMLKRLSSANCPICDRAHKSDSPFMYIIKNTVFFNCRRNSENRSIKVGDLMNIETKNSGMKKEEICAKSYLKRVPKESEHYILKMGIEKMDVETDVENSDVQSLKGMMVDFECLDGNIQIIWSIWFLRTRLDKHCFKGIRKQDALRILVYLYSDEFATVNGVKDILAILEILDIWTIRADSEHHTLRRLRILCHRWLTIHVKASDCFDLINCYESIKVKSTKELLMNLLRKYFSECMKDERIHNVFKDESELLLLMAAKPYSEIEVKVPASQYQWDLRQFIGTYELKMTPDELKMFLFNEYYTLWAEHCK